MHKGWRTGLLAIVAVLTILGAMTGKVQQTPAAQKAEAEVRAALMDFAASYGKNDVEKYFSYYADDLITWWPGGRRMEKETYHKSWAENVAKGGGNTTAEVTDLKIHVAPSGDAAVTSYLLKVQIKNGPPTRQTAEYQMSPTWFKRNGKWQVVHLQFSTRTPPAPPARP